MVYIRVKKEVYFAVNNFQFSILLSVILNFSIFNKMIFKFKMDEWLRITLVLCTYGFFRELRPSEPFVSEFLSGSWRDITAEQVTQLVYPVGTYSYLALLVVAFLVTDMLRFVCESSSVDSSAFSIV